MRGRHGQHENRREQTADSETGHCRDSAGKNAHQADRQEQTEDVTSKIRRAESES